ncbi:hypothetical protein [Brevibacterium picturae]
MRAPLRAARFPDAGGQYGFMDLLPYHGDIAQENRDSHTVRIFPDYADTVLWLDGPVDYVGSGLSSELICVLQEWEQSYYDSLDSDLEWKSPSAARAFTAMGIDMAGRVANELGAEFAIEFASYEADAPTHTVRSRRSANNMQASATFANIVSEMESEKERVARMVADGRPGAGWTAVAPLSGAVYAPGDRGLGVKNGD